MTNLIRAFRKMQGFSQDQLACKSGITQPEISKLERDLLPTITPARKEKLARALGTHPDMLFIGEKREG